MTTQWSDLRISSTPVAAYATHDVDFTEGVIDATAPCTIVFPAPSVASRNKSVFVKAVDLENGIVQLDGLDEGTVTIDGPTKKGYVVHCNGTANRILAAYEG